MDTRLRYQEIIKSILQEHAHFHNTIPDGYHFKRLVYKTRKQEFESEF